jgi:LuxR family transcriptional regulator, maltose regulon positive regulatory protein
MSLAVAASLPDLLPPFRAGVPVVPHWALPRLGLDRILDRGGEGILTLVSAPTGAGKTLGVASWAARSRSPERLVWVNLSRGGSEPDRLWRLLRQSLQCGGGRDLPPAPVGAPADPNRTRALVALGEALSRRSPWTVVLDGFPTGVPSQLGTELEIVLDHAGRSLRLVLLSRGEPALDLHRFSAAGELARVSEVDLVMDDVEIAGVLRLAHAPADGRTVGAVASHSLGWACGVRRAAVALVAAPESAGALEEAERAIAEYLAREVLDAMTPAVRRLLVWTSLVEVVAPDLVAAALGEDSRRETDRAVAETGLLDTGLDGSLRCHPLLRAAARSRLAQEHPDGARTMHRRIVRWYTENGAAETALTLCLAARDWSQSAWVLVQSHAVPRLVAGIGDAATRQVAELPQVQGADHLIQAAVALANGDVFAAEAALAVTSCDPGHETHVRRLGVAFVRLGIARLSGRSSGPPEFLPGTRGLLAEASVAALDGLTDVAAALDAFAGAEEVSRGAHDRAAVTLARGADRSMDCAGQLAVLEACRGDLRRATVRARAVLAAATDDSQVGVAHARIALAWVAMERCYLAEAQARLDEAASASPVVTEPWLFLAHQLVQARVLTASGRPDEALRLFVLHFPEPFVQGTEWLAHLTASVSAEAWLAAGEPQRALGVVTVDLAAGSPERAVLTAMACRDIGDARGAAAAVTSTHELHRASRATQLQGWMLEARLAVDRDQVDRATTLVERVLRSASAEGLRRPLVADGPWLRWFLDRDGSALRELRPFVRSLVGPGAAAVSSNRPVTTSAEAVVEPLTERETQVLELLAQMCSTDEIAAELFVSPNTVKTHLKGIFRKYSVNRRVDAVRRGRELGLC